MAKLGRPRTRKRGRPKKGKEITIDVRAAYMGMKALYFPQASLRSSGLAVGSPIDVVWQRSIGNKNAKAETVTTSGRMNWTGILSGMAEVYEGFKLKAKDQIIGIVKDKYTLSIESVSPAGGVTKKSSKPSSRRTVAARKGLKSIYMPVFRMYNFEEWKPRTETDVYFAFGVLQEFTGYRYCSGTSIEVLREWGMKETGGRAKDTKPDSVLIDDGTKQYLVAEFKMNSSDFSSNHKKKDVDLLVVWDDDSNPLEKKKLPETLCLKEIALKAFKQKLDE